MELRDRDDLARLMRLKDFNDRTLAAAAGLNHTTIYRLRRGIRRETHLDTATAIADALDVAVAKLFRPMEQDAPSRGTDSEGDQEEASASVLRQQRRPDT
jgi:transcriptional regulator with XRE-family HTH domain